MQPVETTHGRALRQLLVFAAPIIFGHIGLMLVGTGDMLIAGRHSREALAAIGLAIAIANPILMLGLGLLFALSPLLAQKRGKGQDVTHYFWPAVAYGAIVGVGCTLLTLLSVLLLPLLGFAPELTRIIHSYLIITAGSALGACVYQAVKEFFQSSERTFSPNAIALSAAGLNVLVNYALVFGEFGFPRLDEDGLAWASLIIRVFMAGSLLLAARAFWKQPRFLDVSFFKEAFLLGYPITIAIFFEVMAFCGVTLFIGKFADDQIAAHNIALNIGSLAFMLPMSIASAAGVKVGFYYGERNWKCVRTFSQVSLFLSVCFTAALGTIFYLMPGPILRLFTQDAAVLFWGAKLLFWVACFQLFDGGQVTLAGILRGLSVTRPASVAIFIGYWIIGIPLGYYLGYHTRLEAQGFWIGLAISLAIVAVMLGVILRRKLVSLEQAHAG